jgi:hypothetical protein
MESSESPASRTKDAASCPPSPRPALERMGTLGQKRPSRSTAAKRSAHVPRAPAGSASAMARPTRSAMASRAASPGAATLASSNAMRAASASFRVASMPLRVIDPLGLDASRAGRLVSRVHP